MFDITCKDCCHYPNCPEWNNDNICDDFLENDNEDKKL